MTDDLERHLDELWDDVPVGTPPLDIILRRGRTATRRDRSHRRLRRSLRATAALGGVAAAFVAGTLVAAPDAGTPVAPPAVAPAAFHGELQAPESCADLLASYVDRAVDAVGPWGWVSAPAFSNGAMLGNLARLTDDLPVIRSPQGFSSDAAPRGGFNSSLGTQRSEASTETATSSATGTNVQEAGVDEPDAVKTDGSLLVRLQGSDLITYDVRGPSVEEQGRLALDLAAGEILLTGDTVVAIGRASDARLDQTRVLSVDVADPAAPVVEHTVDYDSALVAARQHGDDVRLVVSAGLPELDFVQPGGRGGRAAQETAAEANRDLVRSTTLEDWLPTMTVDGGEAEQVLDCDQVAVPRADLALDTTAVLGFGAGDPGRVDAVGLAGGTPITYESEDHLYLASGGNEQQVPFFSDGPLVRTSGPGPIGGDDGVTHVYDFALDGTEATYVGAGEVEGRLADRWSLDEHDGVLRMAVEPTSETGFFTSVVTLRAEGDDLVEIGRLDGLGRGEQLQSVRWFPGLALLVTFRQVDPLYAVDLTDDTAPRLLGELKIPGFSEYLHPLGEHRVVGLGEGPGAGPGGRATWGGQAGLFDVTDLAAPQQLDVVHYGARSATLAGTDPRQVTWLPEQRQLLTVVSRDWGRSGWVSALQLGGGRMENRMTQVEYGRDVAAVRLVPLPDGRVVLVTGEDASFFDLG